MKEGLEKAIKIINEEVEFAKQVNSQMAMGMMQIKKLLEKDLQEVMQNGKFDGNRK